VTPEELAGLSRKELTEYRASIQKQREARADKEALAHELQEAIDLTRINELEEEHGDGRIGAAPLRGWIPGRGAVTKIAVVVPLRSDHSYQRFQRLVLQHRKNPTRSIQAIEQLGRLCLAYPHHERDKDAYEATLELAPVLLNTVAKMVQDLADADEEADAKKSVTS
jgi:hypothetical protein